MAQPDCCIRYLNAVCPVNFEHNVIFANLNPAFHTRKITELDPTRDCYWSPAVYTKDTATNTLDKVVEVVALIIDDVGSAAKSRVSELAVEMALGAPTGIVRTSPDNYQWTYKLSRAIPVAEWKAWREGVEVRISAPRRLDNHSAQCLFRVPMGVNSRADGCAVELVGTDAGAVLDVDSIVPVAASVSTLSSNRGPSQRIRNTKGLMKLWPNNTGYAEWIATGERLMALALDPEEGREAWLEWSARPLASVDKPGEADAKWDTFTADVTRGQWLLDEIQAHDPLGFDAWWQSEAGAAFDDGEAPPAEPKAKSSGITATPYQWIDPDKLPLRDWLYGKLLIRKFISMTVAPGGVGKSSLIAVETLAQVTGQPLLGETPPRPLRVWLWNLEDPHEETQRKIQAVALHYGISEADIGGRLWVDSGRDQPLVVAQMESGRPTIARPIVKNLVEQIRLNKIDIVVVDPFVSCHELPENDNTAQDMIVKEWGRVAEMGGCAVHLVDHTRKAPAETEINTESSRGAKSKTDAARVVRVINRMTRNEGEKVFGIQETRRYFHALSDKANMAPPADKRDWFHLDSVWLGNGGGAAAAFSVNAEAVTGDSVGVVTRWVPPSAADLVTGDSFKAMINAMGDKQWRKDYQAKDKWIGIPAAKACNLCDTTPGDRVAIKEVLKTWFKAGLLKEVSQTDENRKTRKFIVIAGGF